MAGAGLAVAGGAVQAGQARPGWWRLVRPAVAAVRHSRPGHAWPAVLASQAVTATQYTPTPHSGPQQPVPPCNRSFLQVDICPDMTMYCWLQSASLSELCWPRLGCWSRPRLGTKSKLRPGHQTACWAQRWPRCRPGPGLSTAGLHTHFFTQKQTFVTYPVKAYDSRAVFGSNKFDQL